MFPQHSANNYLNNQANKEHSLKEILTLVAFYFHNLYLTAKFARNIKNKNKIKKVNVYSLVL